MVGVDLSPKMVEISKSKGGYDELMVDDVHNALAAQRDNSLDLLLSADTFIYVGELDRCFSLAGDKLVRGGLFGFSVELLQEEHDVGGFRLQRSGRYAHTARYISQLGSKYGMGVSVKTDIVVRKEQATPIPGLLYILRRDL